MRSIRARPRLPGGISRPAASSILAPSAVSIPAPPSVEALPPMPSTSREAPASSAAAISWPKPTECASSGSSGSSSESPLARASSTTAVPSERNNHSAPTGRPSGPVTVAAILLALGSTVTNASRVPSPPSAIGRVTTSSAGLTDDQPRAIAAATALAEAVPLNESGATTTRFTLRAWHTPVPGRLVFGSVGARTGRRSRLVGWTQSRRRWRSRSPSSRPARMSTPTSRAFASLLPRRRGAARGSSCFPSTRRTSRRGSARVSWTRPSPSTGPSSRASARSPGSSASTSSSAWSSASRMPPDSPTRWSPFSPRGGHRRQLPQAAPL